MVNPQYEIEHGDGKVTAWGGMSLMKEVLERIGMSRHLAQAPPPPFPNASATGDIHRRWWWRATW